MKILKESMYLTEKEMLMRKFFQNAPDYIKRYLNVKGWDGNYKKTPYTLSQLITSYYTLYGVNGEKKWVLEKGTVESITTKARVILSLIADIQNLIQCVNSGRDRFYHSTYDSMDISFDNFYKYVNDHKNSILFPPTFKGSIEPIINDALNKTWKESPNFQIVSNNIGKDISFICSNAKKHKNDSNMTEAYYNDLTRLYIDLEQFVVGLNKCVIDLNEKFKSSVTKLASDTNTKQYGKYYFVYPIKQKKENLLNGPSLPEEPEMSPNSRARGFVKNKLGEDEYPEIEFNEVDISNYFNLSDLGRHSQNKKNSLDPVYDILKKSFKPSEGKNKEQRDGSILAGIKKEILKDQLFVFHFHNEETNSDSILVLSSTGKDRGFNILYQLPYEVQRNKWAIDSKNGKESYEKEFIMSGNGSACRWGEQMREQGVWSKQFKDLCVIQPIEGSSSDVGMLDIYSSDISDDDRELINSLGHERAAEIFGRDLDSKASSKVDNFKHGYEPDKQSDENRIDNSPIGRQYFSSRRANDEIDLNKNTASMINNSFGILSDYVIENGTDSEDIKKTFKELSDLLGNKGLNISEDPTKFKDVNYRDIENLYKSFNSDKEMEDFDTELLELIKKAYKLSHNEKIAANNKGYVIIEV